jgi:hypothetical protein
MPKQQQLASLLFAACLVLGNSMSVASSQAKDPILTIRQRYAAINKGLVHYKKIKKDLSGFSAEGGELVAYFQGANVMKLAATYYGETGRATEDYYYWNGELIFVLRRNFTYNQPLSGKIIRTEEERFYFDNDKMIKWINEEGKEVAPSTAEFAAKQEESLKSSRQFVEGSRSKVTTIEATN